MNFYILAPVPGSMEPNYHRTGSLVLQYTFYSDVTNKEIFYKYLYNILKTKFISVSGVCRLFTGMASMSGVPLMIGGAEIIKPSDIWQYRYNG